LTDEETETYEVPKEAQREWAEWVNSRKITQLAHELDSLKQTVRAMNARISRIHALIVKPRGQEEEEREEEEETKPRETRVKPQISLENAVLERFYRDFPA